MERAVHLSSTADEHGGLCSFRWGSNVAGPVIREPVSPCSPAITSIRKLASHEQERHGGRSHGRVCGDWPGLEMEQLYERRDLAITTDFRDVLGEVVKGHLGQKVDQVFPGYTPRQSLGLLNA